MAAIDDLQNYLKGFNPLGDYGGQELESFWDEAYRKLDKIKGTPQYDQFKNRIDANRDTSLKMFHTGQMFSGNQPLDGGALTYWMDKIQKGDKIDPGSMNVNAQNAFYKAKFLVDNPAIGDAVRSAVSSGQTSIAPQAISDAYKQSFGQQAPAQATPSPDAKTVGGGGFIDKIQSWLDGLKSNAGKVTLGGSSRGPARQALQPSGTKYTFGGSSKSPVIEPLQPMSPTEQGGTNLGLTWGDVQREAGTAAGTVAGAAKGAAGIVFDPFGINRGIIDVVTGKPWDPKQQLGNVVKDWTDYGGFVGDTMSGAAAPVATRLGLPTPSEAIKGGIGGAVGGATRGTPVDQNAPSGGGGSTMGDEIPMPSLGDYRGIPGESLQEKMAVLSQLNPAVGIGYSPWRDMALNKQAGEEAQLRDQAAQQSATAAAQARQALAMRGGLRGGSAERIARSSAENLARGQQGIGMQGVINRADIGMQGAQMDTDVNKFNALQRAQMQQQNIGQAIGDIGQRGDWERFKYGEQMKLKGAGMTGQAIKNAGKK